MPLMQTPFAMYDALSSIEVPPEKVRVVVQSMEHDMALFATRSQFDQLDQFSGSRFDLLRAAIAASRERIEQMDKRFDQVDQRFEQIDKRFERMDDQFQAAIKFNGERFTRLSADIKELEQRVATTVAVKIGGLLVLLLAALETIRKLWLN
jgi:hypothetical protein